MFIPARNRFITIVGYEWIIRAYAENIRLPTVLITRSLTTEVISIETMTIKDPKYPNSSRALAVSIFFSLPSSAPA